MSHSDRITEVCVLQQLKLGLVALAREPHSSQWNVGVGGMMGGVKHQPLKIHAVASLGTASTVTTQDKPGNTQEWLEIHSQ